MDHKKEIDRVSSLGNFLRASRTFLFIALASLVAGCVSGSDQYYPPNEQNRIRNSIVVNQSKTAVWNKIVKQLSENFVQIDYLDKSSGIIHLKLRGESEKLLDCGRYHVEFTNLRGKRVFDFPGSRPRQKFLVASGPFLYRFDRRLELIAVVNIAIESKGRRRTQVTVNVEYNATLTVYVEDVLKAPMGTTRERLTFRTHEVGKFDKGCICISSGFLEELFLNLVADQ